jgi:hypothetical protein
MDRIVVESLTTQLLSIEATSKDARLAQDLAGAVASAYVDTVQDSVSSVTGETVGALRTREADLGEQLRAVAARIGVVEARAGGEDPKSSAGRQSAESLDRLIADQSDLALEQEKVRQELAAIQPTSPSDMVRIIQPATPATGPAAVQRTVVAAVTGAFLAAAAVGGTLLIRLRVNSRLRGRDDIADAVSSTVVADVRTRPQRSAAQWTALLETYEASAGDAWAFRQVLRAITEWPDNGTPDRLGGKKGRGHVDHPPSVTIVSLSSDRRAVAVGPQLAAFASSHGIRTRLSFSTGNDSAPALGAACSSRRGHEVRPGLYLEAWAEQATPIASGALRPPMAEIDCEDSAGSATLDSELVDVGRGSGNGVGIINDIAVGTLPGDGDGDADVPAGLPPREGAAQRRVLPKHRSADLWIVLAVADIRRPALMDVPFTARTLLAISPGVGTGEDLARLAVAVDDAGRQIDGIVIADPDPSDRTTGRRPLDDRTRRAPLPVRMTGISEAPLSIVEPRHRR